MKEIIFTIKENSNGEIEANALNHSIFTIADSFEEIKEKIKDAVYCHFDKEQMPNIINYQSKLR